MASVYTVNDETLMNLAEVLGGEEGIVIIKILKEKELEEVEND